MTLLSASKLLVKWVAVKAVSTINFRQNKSTAVSAGSVGVHRKVVAACALSLCFFLNTAYAVDYTFTSSSTGSFNLNSGDTLTIQSGTFQTGTNGLNQIPSGATVTVESGATLDASNNFNGGAGTLNVNDGAVATFGGPPISGMTFNIDGNVSFGSNPSMNAPSLFNISSTGVMNLDGQFTLANSSVITNNGSIFYDSDFSIQGGTTFDNNSYVKGSALTGNLNLNGNTVNDGLIDTEGFINFNSQGDVVNQCSMIALNGYNNQSASTINSGIIITVNPTSVLQNNNTFNNTATGYLQAGGTINQNFLNNNGGIFGGGNIYIAGNSTNQAAFGTDTDTNVINVYDPSVAALGATVYFDTQNVTPDLTEVTKVAFSPLTAQDVRDNYLNSGICNYDPFATAVASVDYGDAPDSYQDASHTIVSGMQLGAVAPDAESTSLNLANGGVDGTGDNLAGIADEDGVTIPPLTLGVAAVITATVSGTNGKLQGWIDWNGDGDFEDLGEQLLSNVQDNGVGDADLSVGSIGFSVTPALSSTTGTTYARFRWSSDSNVASTGLASDGEVEDYEINIADQPVSSLTPFVCDSTFYEVISGQLAELNIDTGQYDSIGAVQTPYNATGYNINDNYIYGLQVSSRTDSGPVVRVGSDGSSEVISPSVGNLTSIAGTFDSTNRLFYSGSATQLNYVDVSTSTLGSVSFSAAGSPVFGFDVAYTKVGGDDIIASLASTTLSIWNLTTGNSYTVTGLPTQSGDYGAGWGTLAGQLYFSNNNSGQVYKIDNLDSTPTATPVINAEVSRQHDGMNCPTAPAPFEPTAQLTLVKTVVNDDAGASSDTDWTLSATNGTTTISGIEGSADVTAASVAVGTYTLSESGPSGYKQTGLYCVGAADTDLTDGLTLAEDETVTCTFTNNDEEPVVTGSTPTPIASSNVTPEAGYCTALQVLRGTHLFTVPAGVTELHYKGWGAGGHSDFNNQTSGPGGYTEATIPVTAGEQYTIIVGSRGGFAGGVNDHGFGGEGSTAGSGGGLTGLFTGNTAISSDEQSRAILIAGGGGGSDRTIPVSTEYTTDNQTGGSGGDPVNGGGQITMKGANGSNIVGVYDGLFPRASGAGGGGYSGGYLHRRSGNSEGYAGNGGTNYINSALVVSGSEVNLFTPEFDYIPPNTSDVHYVSPLGEGEPGAGAGNDGLVVLQYSDGSCNEPVLTLEKVVVNDDGGTALDIDWTLSATDGTTTISGNEGDASITSASLPAGTYTLSESGPSGYARTDLSCSGAADTDLSDGLTLATGETVSCTFTNDDTPPAPPSTQPVWSIAGDTSVAEGACVDYTISMTGTTDSTSIDLGITNISTAAADYSNLNTAVTDAVAAYTGNGSLNWDGTTLSFTGSDETMSDLTFTLCAETDAEAEATESYNVAITNPVMQGCVMPEMLARIRLNGFNGRLPRSTVNNLVTNFGSNGVSSSWTDQGAAIYSFAANGTVTNTTDVNGAYTYSNNRLPAQENGYVEFTLPTPLDVPTQLDIGWGNAAYPVTEYFIVDINDYNGVGGWRTNGQMAGFVGVSDGNDPSGSTAWQADHASGDVWRVSREDCDMKWYRNGTEIRNLTRAPSSVTGNIDNDNVTTEITDVAPGFPAEVAANVCAIAPSTQFWLRAAEWSADAAPNGFGAKNINYTALASADPFTFGSGITVANVSSRTEITGVDQTNYTDAFIDGDYIEYTFTMQNGLSDTYVLSGMSENGGTLGENYKIDFMISSNDFATATRLATGVPVDADIPSNTFSWITDAAQVYLTAGTQYKVRAVFYDATAPSGRISMDDFAISIDQCTDKGDAPYGTGDANAGSHYLAATRDYYIGTVSPDAEFYVTNDDNTSGDVTTDEEAGVVLPVFPSGATVSIDIPVNGSGGKLNAWIDWNGNEVFDSNEKIATDVGLAVPAASGTITLPVTVPANAVGGNSYARFRWSPNSVVNATDNVLEGEIEDYPVVISTGSTLSGIIFEDINYGGGAGRDLASASGVGINGVTVELYDNTGAYVTSTTTANNGTSDGAYEFTGISDGDYFVRVVNDTVGSTRSGANGSELGVQTFRSDGTTDVSNEVGGRNPAVADASVYNAGSPSTLNTTTYQFTNGALNGQQAQSLQAITVAAADASDINFGFNFDTIVNTNDAGQGSLRQFILNSNLLGNAGLNQVDNAADGATDPAPGVETSIFEIPGAGVHEITPLSALPAVTDSFTALDATTQQGASCVAGSRSLQVQLDGTSAGNTASGLSISASDAIIRGFAIGAFGEEGIYGNANADNLVVACNNVGLEADGSTLSGNDLNGIWVEDASNITIGGSTDTERNVVSGNTRHGINVDGVTNAVVQHNYVGTDATGTSARTNNTEGAQYGGVAAISNAQNVDILDNLISGNDRVLINSSVNTTDGIYLNTADTINIKRNLIGTQADGLSALGNSGAGIYSFNTKNILVGGSVADRNVISGNGEDGISSRFGTDTLTVLSNYIGVAADGTTDLGNTDNGIFLQDTSNAVIGNSTAAGKNIISGNDISGVRVSASDGAMIKGNYIGLDDSGMASLGNTLHGVYVQNSAGVEVGGPSVNDRNVVSGNGNIGVFVVGSVSDTLVENNIVGLYRDGNTPAGNAAAGVETLNTSGVVINNNVISSNGTRGVHIANSPDTTITNNLIGLNEAGNADRGNSSYGVDVVTAAANIAIDGNTIAGNGNRGIRIINGDATNNTVTNNRIGVALDGVTPMGNTNGGVLISLTSGVTVGGANDSNIIAHNTGDAVTVMSTGANDNTISRNVMYANTGLGIDLDEDNVTLNDSGDVDSGFGNDGLNFPQISQVMLIGSDITVIGCAPANSTVELFEADVSPTSSSGEAAGANTFTRSQDYGEGEVFLTDWQMPATGTACSLPVDADGNNSTGMLEFTQTFALSSLPAGASLVLDDLLTATATVAGTGTSEFSAVVAVASFDYGDAPLSGISPNGAGTNNYGIAQHAVITGMSLGTVAPDIDASYQDSSLADGDDRNGTDDEDGLLLPALVAGDTQYTIVSADISAVGSGTLHAWIDFDGNGLFDADEHRSTTVSSGTAGSLSWNLDGLAGNPNFPLAGSATTFARFRFTTDTAITASTPASIASNGEVEDYAIDVLDNTPDTLERPGVCGGFVSRGWATDAAGTLHDNDINFNSGSSQDDPYAFLALRRQASGKIVSSFGTPLEVITGSIPTRAGNNLITTARFDAGHQSEYHSTIFRLEGAAGTTQTVNYDTNGGAEYSAYWIEDSAGNVLSSADFVYTFANGGGNESFDIPVTYPADGVVYVYTVLFDPTQAYGRPTLLDYTCPTDYSDGLADGADTPNGTLAASAYGEATHQLLAGIQLGATVTPDTASVLAADDASDDAIASFPVLSEVMTSYQIAAADISATGDGTLMAWIDFDGDGAYQADEYATAAVVAGVVQTDLSWAFSDIMAAGTTYARFRLTSDTLADDAGTATLDERATLFAIDGEVEDYAIEVALANDISGVVFEDINYGGGAGREQTAASGVGVNGATVELYDNTGTLVATTTTANDGTNDGAYTFTGLLDGDYHVRVVSDTVNSTRSGSDGSELAVQTYRHDGTTAITAEVGGRLPSGSDATAHDAASPSVLNTTNYTFTGGTLDGGQSQSITTVTLAGANATGLDFGYNFDTIVNANDAGQGSLRQFILNSNQLTGEASLAQVGQPAAWETSIFMIPSADLSAGVATIELDTGLPIITGSSTALDAGTQTSNIGNTNAGTSGTGGTVGVDNLVLPTYQNPEVEIDANDFNGLRVDSAGEVLIARIAIYDTDAASPLIDKAGVGLTSASLLTIENAFIGPRATGADPGAGERLGRSYDDVDFTSPPNVIFRDSLFAYSENSGLHADDTGGTYHLSGSELHHLVLTNSGQDAVDAGGTWTTIGNLMHNNGSSSSSSSSGGAGFELGAASNAQVSANSVIENNTLHSNFGPGIRLRNTVTNTTVSKNVIYDNLYAGVQVQLRATGVGVESTITQNSIYNNAELGIDISHNTSTGDPDQVTLNDANDVDGGPNGGLNFPQFTRAVQSGSDLIIQGCAPTGSTIELFEADVSAGSSSGASAGDNQFGLTQDYGEGETYITSFVEGVGEDSSLNAVSCNGLSDADGNDASGMSPFQWRVALPSGLQIGDKITATATIAGTGTSEFSAVAVISGQDYGDAPNSYRTTLLSDGARHDIINGVYLGNAQPDIDVDGQPSVAASADGADEDGVSSFNSLTTSDRIYSVTARVNNDTVDQATLIAWIDFDRNGSFDADEAAIRTIPAGTNAANFTLNWSNIPLDIAAGDTFVRLRVTTDNLNNREPFGAKLDGEVEDYPITITIAGVTVSGRVYNDANVNTVSDSNEVGVTQLPVVLYDTVNNVCVSTRTDGSGRFIFKDVVAGTYQVYEASRENVPVPSVCGVAGAKNPSGYRSTTDNVRAPFTVTSNDITGQDFGDVKSPVFEPSNTDKILPGNVLFYTHKLTTPAKGTVTFDSVSSGNKSKGWASIIYRDANCDGQLNQTDHTMRLSGQAVAVSAGDSVCVINKVYAPSNVAANDQYVQTITADFDYNNAIAGSVALSVTDVTTAGQVATPTLPATPAVVAEPATPAQAPVEATPTTPYIPAVEEVPAQAPVAATPVTPVVGPSRLELRKTVRNVSQAGSLETETINQALPGDTLEYRVYYSNTGTGPVTELVINDNVPPYTSLQGMPTCGTAPAGMTCTPSLPSGDGVEWVFSGALVGGASGVVSYRVVVDD